MEDCGLRRAVLGRGCGAREAGAATHDDDPRRGCWRASCTMYDSGRPYAGGGQRRSLAGLLVGE